MSRHFATLVAVTANVVAAQDQAGDSPPVITNTDVSYWLGWFWVAFIAAFLTYTTTLYLIHYVRTVACLNNSRQRYFFTPNSLYGGFKKHFLDAALFGRRHHREMKLSTALNVGTVPNRLQMLFLVGYFAMNIAYCLISIDYTLPTEDWAPQLRNRSGVVCVMNMVPLFIFAGRNNPFIKMAGISFDTFNLCHRWVGRIVVLEALCHTLAYMVPKVRGKGWDALAHSISGSEFIMTGFIAMCAFFGLMIFSPSIIRHAFYETFLHLHIALAVLGVATLWYHLKDLPQIDLMWGIIAIWAAERFIRFFRIFYRNIGSGGTTAEIETLPGDALRVTLRLARPWKFRPGQHVYLYMPKMDLWMNHPFSLAWSDEATDMEMANEKQLPVSSQDVLAPGKTTMSLIIRRRTGFTEKLFKKTSLSAAGRISTSCFVEGPYGGESLTSYGTVMLWAAGVGITHQVPHVRDIVSAYANGATATRRLTLVWIIQSPEHLEWIRPWMTTILSMDHRREILRILLFVTRPRSTKEIHSPSSSVQMFPGKPNVQALVDQEMTEGIGAACVSVCGAGALADDLRRAVRIREDVWNVDFKEESFSW